LLLSKDIFRNGNVGFWYQQVSILFLFIFSGHGRSDALRAKKRCCPIDLFFKLKQKKGKEKGRPFHQLPCGGGGGGGGEQSVFFLYFSFFFEIGNGFASGTFNQESRSVVEFQQRRPCRRRAPTRRR